jgi:hypothetical protein
MPTSWRSHPGASNPAYKHGHTEGGKFSPEYHSWASMLVRCDNKNSRVYKHCGGRGITVCERWRSFDNFLADMGARPKGASLDRIDNDKNYCADNCRWADRVTQARNSKQVVWVCLWGRKQRLVEWCEELGISINTVRDRVKYKGYTYETAIQKGVMSK